jgi:predicted nuclease with TOPRIM domain
MKKVVGSFFVLVSIFCLWGIPSFAADPSDEIEQLKGEVRKLLQKIEELEKRQTEAEMKAKEAEKKAIEIEKKTGETEKKFSEVEKKTEEVKKRSLKDRIELGGEARFRIVLDENASTNEHFYGNGNLSEELKFRDETSFPLRIRLNAHAEVVPEWVDLYARLTMNKRWGAFDESMTTDPFNSRNSFEASYGHDITPRFEHAYMTLTIPYVNG